jgi:signal transduction histidine kinase
LDTAVADMASVMEETAVDLSLSGDQRRYGGAALVALYRAVQEALTNVRKHAQAARVSVDIDLGEAVASLSVIDDGRGFAAADSTEGYGLRGMRERLELVGGALTVDSRAGGGTRLVVRIPRGAS